MQDGNHNTQLTPRHRRHLHAPYKFLLKPNQNFPHRHRVGSRYSGWTGTNEPRRRARHGVVSCETFPDIEGKIVRRFEELMTRSDADSVTTVARVKGVAGMS